MCRKFSVENIGVENFPLKMEKWPVENFLSKIVMFALTESEKDKPCVPARRKFCPEKERLTSS